MVPFDIFDFWAGCFLRDTHFFDRSWYIKLELSSGVRLNKAKQLRERLRQWVESRLVFERVQIESGITAISKEMQIPPSGLSKQEVGRLGRKPQYQAYSAWRGANDGKYHAMSVFDVVSTRPSQPARALAYRLEEAKKNITGTRPAIVFLHIFDPWNLGALLSPQAASFQARLLQLLGDENGRKISALVLTCEPQKEPMTGIVGVKDYPALWVLNPQANVNLPRRPGSCNKAAVRRRRRVYSL